MALNAVIVDSHAMARDLLGTVLANGSYEVVGQAHTSSRGLALVQKFNPHFVCIDNDLAEDGENVVDAIRASSPKTLIFLVSASFDAATIQAAMARGVHGFIVKPFNADAVLKTIRNAVLAMIKRQQQG